MPIDQSSSREAKDYRESTVVPDALVGTCSPARSIPSTPLCGPAACSAPVCMQAQLHMAEQRSSNHATLR